MQLVPSSAYPCHYCKADSLWGMRVNAVSSGPVDSAMVKLVHSSAIRAAYHESVPFGRYGSEEEIAEVELFFCPSKASFVAGQVLAVDGGFDAGGVGLPNLRRNFGFE